MIIIIIKINPSIHENQLNKKFLTSIADKTLKKFNFTNTQKNHIFFIYFLHASSMAYYLFKSKHYRAFKVIEIFLFTVIILLMVGHVLHKNWFREKEINKELDQKEH